MSKDKIAGVIRKITVPPVLAVAMLLILRAAFGDGFITFPLLAAEILFLVIVPVSAYPLSRLRSGEKAGREGQRRLAFVMNLLGYALALAAGIIGGRSGMLLRILWGYFLAALLLTLLNKVGKIRASGHACSCTLPYLFFCDYLGAGAAVVCAALYLAEFWASVRLKRHTVREFLLGSLTAGVIFLLAVFSAE